MGCSALRFWFAYISHHWHESHTSLLALHVWSGGRGPGEWARWAEGGLGKVLGLRKQTCCRNKNKCRFQGLIRLGAGRSPHFLTQQTNSKWLWEKRGPK